MTRRINTPKQAAGGQVEAVRVYSDIDNIDAAQWNALVPGNNPFLKHEFLAALERHGCVGHQFGWRPVHLAWFQEGRLCAAMPLYLKDNSYGEFVFDHAWASAYQRHGLSYYPKLVSSIPYTPAGGRRLLVAGDVSEDEAFTRLTDRALELAGELGASSLHWLFVTEAESRRLGEMGFQQRLGVQFHWHNQGYASFEEFLSTLTSKRRKNIRRERRLAQGTGLDIRLLHGSDVSMLQWSVFARFYAKTFEERFSLPTLNEGFFAEIGRTLGDQVILVLAYERQQPVAGALLFRGDHVLYGRHWGCEQEYDSLHFEACYYQGIEYAIANGLQSFEPGAQGEHKIWRGFMPTLTYSQHWLAHPGFSEAIGDFLQRETPALLDYKRQLEAGSPYRQS